MDCPPLDSIARQHGALLVLQHGSTVAGTAHRGSDFDVAILLDHFPTTEAYLSLIADLQAAFPGRELDVVLLNRADPLLLKRVTERCVLLYGSAARLRDLKLYAFKRYQDHRRYLAFEREYVRRKVASARA
jgi:predicted nucleotidyltransferase